MTYILNNLNSPYGKVISNKKLVTALKKKKYNSPVCNAGLYITQPNKGRSIVLNNSGQAGVLKSKAQITEAGAKCAITVRDTRSIWRHWRLTSCWTQLSCDVILLCGWFIIRTKWYVTRCAKTWPTDNRCLCIRYCDKPDLLCIHFNNNLPTIYQ